MSRATTATRDDSFRVTVKSHDTPLVKEEPEKAETQ